jgi:hypothetical protein
LGERADVGGLDERVVLTPEQVFEQYLEGERQPLDGGKRFRQGRQAVDVDGAPADADLAPCAEAVQCGHDLSLYPRALSCSGDGADRGRPVRERSPIARGLDCGL